MLCTRGRAYCPGWSQKFTQEEASMNVKHLGLIALTAVVAAGLAGMSTSNAGAAVAAAPANCVIRTYTGDYVTAVGGGGRETDVLHTNATQIGSWERFALVPAGNGMVAIQTVDGHYLTAVGGGGLFDGNPSDSVIHSDAPWIRDWEKFTLVPLNNGRTFAYAIRTFNGYELSAFNGGGQTQGQLVMESNATGTTTWEQFQVICGL
jgi:hypothetical protein